MPILLLSQLSQFGAYAFFTPASVYYVNEAVPSHYKVTGQAALGMATMGLSGMFGNLLGGYLIDAFSAGMMSIAALLFVIAGTVFVFAGTAKTKNGFAGK